MWRLRRGSKPSAPLHRSRDIIVIAGGARPSRLRLMELAGADQLPAPAAISGDGRRTETYMDGRQQRARTLDDWIFNPTAEDMVCVNAFHDTMLKVYTGYSAFDPDQPDQNDIKTKIANLMRAQLILLGGDVIYVREGDTLHTLGDSADLLSYYMHGDSREARKAMDLLETNFQGYFPVVDGLAWRNVMKLVYPDGSYLYVDLKTLNSATVSDGSLETYPEYGSHIVHRHNFEPIQRFFGILDQAVGEPWFFEKTMMYHFNQPYREKSHVLVGGGGNGKSMFMGLVQRLYGDFALTDAPQPNFSGHAAAVVAYNFIGKRIVTFNDVGDPSAKFLEWLKRMITGNLEVKTPSGAWLSIPCNANFMMETNHAPQILSLEAHRRRFVIREFDSTFRLKDYIDDPTLDKLGDRGDITAGDLVNYLLTIRDKVSDWAAFGSEPELEFYEEA